MQNDVMRPVRYIRITQPASLHLCFSWLGCYDLAGNNVCVGRNSANAQHTSSGNGKPYADPWGLTAPVLTRDENLRTDSGNAYCSAGQNAGNYWQVDLGGNGVVLKSIKYRNCNSHPSLGKSVVITLWDKDDKQITAQGAQFTTSASETVKTETFDVVQNNLGYTGKHDEHISPVVALLDSLKNKLANSKKISTDRVENLTGEYKKAQKAAELAEGAMNEAVKIDNSEGARTAKELEMIDNILAMVHTLNGKK